MFMRYVPVSAFGFQPLASLLRTLDTQASFYVGRIESTYCLHKNKIYVAKKIIQS